MTLPSRRLADRYAPWRDRLWIWHERARPNRPIRGLRMVRPLRCPIGQLAALDDRKVCTVRQGWLDFEVHSTVYPTRIERGFV